MHSDAFRICSLFQELPMHRFVKSIAIVSAIVSSLATTPSISLAQEIRIGPGGVRIDDGRRYDGRRCDLDLAMDKARDRGIRRGRIVNRSSNSVAIDGMTRRGPMRAEFYNRRGCPIIRTFYLR